MEQRNKHFYKIITFMIAVVALISLPDSSQQNSGYSEGALAEADSRQVNDMRSQSFAANTKQASNNTLRILYHRLFHDGFGISQVEKQLIEKFAVEHQLQAEWIEVDERWELLPAIFQNQGDVIVSQGYDVAGGLEGIVKFTEPWGKNQQLMVVRGTANHINSITELQNRQIVLKRSSPAWHKLEQLAQSNNRIKLVLLPEDLSEKTILDRVAQGVYDIAVLDADYLQQTLPEYQGLTVVEQQLVNKNKAWAVLKDNVGLRDKLNEFLNRELFAAYQAEKQFFDLPELKEKGIVRLISYQSPTNVFYKDGELKGFEYELLKGFAERHKLQLNVVFAQSYSELFALLERGEGDIISASVPESAELNRSFSLSNGYFYSSPVVISRNNEAALLDIHDLDGRTIALAAESPYRDLIYNLRKEYKLDLTIKELDPNINTETLLFMVSLGIHDLTIIPGHTAKAELSRQMNLTAGLNLTDPDKLVWVTRQQDSQLLSALNDYLSENYRQTEFNTLKHQYITQPTDFSGDSKLLSKVFNLTPYDEEIKKYSDQHGFDWRLIAAQMYQESQFDPQAISSAGAEGLMQIMPRTAEELGLEKLKDPVMNIEAGIRYLAKLRDQFEDDLLVMERTWLALAAYNAGFRRINAARKHAATMGLNQNKWFGNVEVAMREMAKMKTENDSRICRCGQTVVYVRDIRTRYNNYIGLTDTTDVAAISSSKTTLLN